MPAFVLPQILLCGLLVPREDDGDVAASGSPALLPLTYAYDALARASRERRRSARGSGSTWRVVVGVTALALVLGAATLRRRTQ